MIVESAMLATSFLPESLSGLLPERLSEYLGDFFDESFFLPAYKGPLILIVGGSAMLALTLVLSLMVQNRHMNVPNPTLANHANTYPHHSHHLREQRARSAYASTRRNRTAHGPSSPSPVQSVKRPKDLSKNTDKKRKKRTGASAHPSRVHESDLPAQAPEKRTNRARAVHESTLISAAKQSGPPPTGPQDATPQGVQNTMSPPGRTTKKNRPTTVTRKSLRSMKKAAKQAGLGSPDHLVAAGGRHAIQLSRCRSCRDPGSGDAGCERERVLLQRALREHDPRGQIVERRCDPYRPGRCRFEIIPGGSR